MPELSTIHPTLLDHAKGLEPDGTVAVVAEILSQTNDITLDGVMVEANQPTGHQMSIRTGLPEVFWKILNQGTAPSTSTKAQITEGMGILTAISEVDVDLADINGNREAYLMSEARAFLEAMSQQWASATFYGNPAVTPERPLGLAPRYSDVSAGNAANIIDGGGGAGLVNTSIWLIVWGSETVFYVYPKGSSIGITHDRMGTQMVPQASANWTAGSSQPNLRLQAIVDVFKLKVGLAVKDWRYAVRIANVEVNAGAGELPTLTGDQAPTSTANILHSMAKAVARIPNLRMGRPAFYMNRTVFSGLQRIALEKSSAVLRINEAVGQFGDDPQAMMSFMKIPIRLCDALVNTEDQVA